LEAGFLHGSGQCSGQIHRPRIRIEVMNSPSFPRPEAGASNQHDLCLRTEVHNSRCRIAGLENTYAVTDVGWNRSTRPARPDRDMRRYPTCLSAK